MKTIQKVAIADITNEKIAKLIVEIERVANKTAASDSEDFNAYDASGGNFDDAYQLGTEDGEIFLASRLINILKGS